MKYVETTAITSAQPRFGLEFIRQAYHNWTVRRRIRALDTYDDRILQDIGVTRDEIAWAGNLPLTVNAAWQISSASRTRRSAEHAKSIRHGI